jgi:hypothetical protein
LFQSVGGKNYEVKRNPNTRMYDIKKQISKQIDVPENSINLLFKGNILKNEAFLSSINPSPAVPVIVHVDVDFQARFGGGASENEGEIKIQPKKETKPVVKQPEIEKVAQPVKEPVVKQPEPADFDEMVGDLMDMGFEIEETARVLRKYKYNKEDAINALLGDDVDKPEQQKLHEIKPENIVQNHNPQQFNQGKYDGIRKNRGNKKKKNKYKPYVAEEYKNKFTYLSENSNTPQRSEYEELLKDVREADKSELIKLCNSGCDIHMETLLSVYYDCEMSISALKEMFK